LDAALANDQSPAQAASVCAPEATSNESELVQQSQVLKHALSSDSACGFIDAAPNLRSVRYLSVEGYGSSTQIERTRFSQLADRENAHSPPQMQQIVLVGNGYDDFALQLACSRANLRSVRILRGGILQLPPIKSAASVAPANLELNLQQALQYGANNALLIGQFSRNQRRALSAPERNVRAASYASLQGFRHANGSNIFVFSGTSEVNGSPELNKLTRHTFLVRASAAEFYAAHEQAKHIANYAAQTKELPCYLR
jgi:hypothetical protein